MLNADPRAVLADNVPVSFEWNLDSRVRDYMAEARRVLADIKRTPPFFPIFDPSLSMAPETGVGAAVSESFGGQKGGTSFEMIENLMPPRPTATFLFTDGPPSPKNRAALKHMLEEAQQRGPTRIPPTIFMVATPESWDKVGKIWRDDDQA